MGIFKAYDIRGTYPAEVDEGMARKIGLFGEKTLVELRYRLRSGLLAAVGSADRL